MEDTWPGSNEQDDIEIEIEIKEERALFLANGVKEELEEEEEEEEVVVLDEKPSSTNTLANFTKRRGRLKDANSGELPLASCPVVMLDIRTDPYYEVSQPERDPLAPDTGPPGSLQSTNAAEPEIIECDSDPLVPVTVTSDLPASANAHEPEVTTVLPDNTVLPASAAETEANSAFVNTSVAARSCSLCQETFASRELMASHTCKPVDESCSPDYKARNEFVCCWCNETFSAHKSLNTHAGNAHRQSVTIYCSWCNRGYPNLTILRRHMCDVFGRTKEKVASSIGDKDAPPNPEGENAEGRRCKWCNIVFPTPSVLHRHKCEVYRQVVLERPKRKKGFMPIVKPIVKPIIKPLGRDNREEHPTPVIEQTTEKEVAVVAVEEVPQNPPAVVVAAEDQLLSEESQGVSLLPPAPPAVPSPEQPQATPMYILLLAPVAEAAAQGGFVTVDGGGQQVNAVSLPPSEVQCLPVVANPPVESVAPTQPDGGEIVRCLACNISFSDTALFMSHLASHGQIDAGSVEKANGVVGSAVSAVDAASPQPQSVLKLNEEITMTVCRSEGMRTYNRKEFNKTSDDDKISSSDAVSSLKRQHELDVSESGVKVRVFDTQQPPQISQADKGYSERIKENSGKVTGTDLDPMLFVKTELSSTVEEVITDQIDEDANCRNMANIEYGESSSDAGASVKREPERDVNQGGVKVHVFDTEQLPQISQADNGYSDGIEESSGKVTGTDLDPMLFVKTELSSTVEEVITDQISEDANCRTYPEIYNGVANEYGGPRVNAPLQSLASPQVNVMDVGRGAQLQFRITCPVCCLEFPEWRKLDQHLMCHLRIVRDCEHCGRIFSKGVLLVHHVCSGNVADRDKPLVGYCCPGCKVTQKGEEVFLQHMDECVRPPRRDGTSCGACGKRMATLAAFQDHVEQMHLAVERCACGICGKMFALRTAKQHLRLRHPMAPELAYQCHYCGKRFRAASWLTRHLSSVHPRAQC